MPGDPADLDSDDAMARGTLIHRLLEHLPLADAKDRHDLGMRIIQTGDATLVASVMRLLEIPSLAWLWVSDALTEVDITADIKGLGRIHGAIDRLIITDTKITAIDYKSNRVVPDNAADTPIGLQRQMAAYHNALAQIYPDHTIEAAILWTDTGTLTVLPDDLLHDALNGVTVP